MSDDNKFWLVIWSLVFITFVVSVSMYHMKKNKVRADLLKSGVAPLAINCALEDEHNREVKCIILALKESN